jgi:hypothetical protein
MSAAELRECQIEIGGSVHCAIEPLVVPYLAGCVRRCDDELRSDVPIVVRDTLTECRSAAIRMIGSVLRSYFLSCWILQFHLELIRSKNRLSLEFFKASLDFCFKKISRPILDLNLITRPVKFKSRTALVPLIFFLKWFFIRCTLQNLTCCSMHNLTSTISQSFSHHGTILVVKQDYSRQNLYRHCLSHNFKKEWRFR